MAVSGASAVDGATLLTSDVRRHIVDHLAGLTAAEGEGLTAAELGDLLGLHSTTVRFHLDQLVVAGLVRSHFVKRGGVGRPAKKYLVVEGELDSVLHEGATEQPYRVLAGLLASVVDPERTIELTPEQAGEEWVLRRLAADGREVQRPAATTGEWVGKVGEVVDLLQDWGYRPDLSVSGHGGDVTLTLRDCPFLDLARQHTAVVCGIHRGLLRGALRVAGEDGAAVSLRPLVDERTCHAVLTRPGATPTTPATDPTAQESTDE